MWATYIWTWQGWAYLATVIRPVLPAGGRLVDRRPHSHRAGGGRAAHGWRR